MRLLNFFKTAIHQQLLNGLNDKIAAFESTFEELKESVSNETKSTAGDKYETARAMLHIEQENVLRQRANAHKQRIELLSIKHNDQYTTVMLGSLVHTDNGIFYISIGHGKLLINNVEIIALSAISPMGKVLLGSSVNETILYNAIEYLILDIN